MVVESNTQIIVHWCVLPGLLVVSGVQWQAPVQISI